MARPPLHALQGFMEIARHGKMAAAATALHLTVSALSHQIRALEDHLGVRLFERGSRGVRLTAEGAALQQRIGPNLDAIEQALRPYRAGRGALLHLSLLSSMANAWLVPRLGRFVALHPQVELNLSTDTALVDFDRDRGIDAALRYGRGQWPGLQADPLFDDWIMPMASPELLARHPDDGRPWFERLPLLGDPGGRWREWFDSFGGTPPSRFAATLGDAESLQRAAVEGIGAALGRLSLARPLLDSGRLMALSGHRLRSEFSHWLVYPPRSQQHEALLAFRSWLLQEAQDWRTQADRPVDVAV